MIKKKKFDTDTNIFLAVDNNLHQNPIVHSKNKKKSNQIENYNMNEILEGIKNRSNISDSVHKLIQFPKEQILFILNGDSDIFPILISYLYENSDDNLNQIASVVLFIKKLCLFPECYEILMKSVPLHNLIESVFNFQTNEKFVKISCCVIKKMFEFSGKFIEMKKNEIQNNPTFQNQDSISEIANFSSIIEQEILFFLSCSDRINSYLFNCYGLKIIYSYLDNILTFPEVFQNSNLVDRLNMNIINLGNAEQVSSSLKLIKLLIHEKGVPFSCFNIKQIIKLMRAKQLSIQVNATKILSTILLIDSVGDFIFKDGLCKSLHWIFLNGAFPAKLQALLCLRTFLDLYSDHFTLLTHLLDEKFFNSILELLYSGDDGTISALSFLLFLIQDNSYPEYSSFAIRILLQDDIHNELEELSIHGSPIVATHALNLLKLVDKSM